MRKALWALLCVVGVPAVAGAGPVGFATYIQLGGGTPGGTAPDVLQSQSAGGADSGATSVDSLALSGSVDISQGKVRASNVSGFHAGSVGSGTDILFYDTLTFAPSAFQGVFGPTYNLPLAAHFDGTFTGVGDFSSSGTGGRIHVYSGTTVVDQTVFADSNSLIDFLFLSGPSPLCASGVNGPSLDSTSGAFAFDVTCNVTVSAANPTVKIFLNFPTYFNVTGGAWDLNMLNTGTLSADFGGRDVSSASGLFPGTVSSVPEPGTLALSGLGLGLAAWRCRRLRASVPRA